jgi:hypothetical protein
MRLALPAQELVVTTDVEIFNNSIAQGFVPANAPDMIDLTGLNIWVSYKPILTEDGQDHPDNLANSTARR